MSDTQANCGTCFGCQHGGECLVAAHEKRPEPQRPTYRIPAREVVPGMILCACEYRWPVKAVGVHGDDMRWIEVQPEHREPTPWAPHAGYYDEAVTHG